MGYKRAGYKVLGNVEIDPQMMRIYRKNHNPPHPFLMPIQDFKSIPDSEPPAELFNLDVLDGSPPCSVFSPLAQGRTNGVENMLSERDRPCSNLTTCF